MQSSSFQTSEFDFEGAFWIEPAFEVSNVLLSHPALGISDLTLGAPGFKHFSFSCDRVLKVSLILQNIVALTMVIDYN